MEHWKQEGIARSVKIAQRENKRRERAKLLECLDGWEPYLRRRNAGELTFSPNGAGALT